MAGKSFAKEKSSRVFRAFQKLISSGMNAGEGTGHSYKEAHQPQFQQNLGYVTIEKGGKRRPKQFSLAKSLTKAH